MSWVASALDADIFSQKERRQPVECEGTSPWLGNGSRRPSAANWARRCSTSPTSKDTDEASAASAVGRRRRSVDCGLDFEQHAHAPLVIPKQWERCLGSSGGSAGRRSSHVAARRLSLDGGLSTAEPASSYAITRCGVSALEAAMAVLLRHDQLKRQVRHTSRSWINPALAMQCRSQWM